MHAAPPIWHWVFGNRIHCFRVGGVPLWAAGAGPGASSWDLPPAQRKDKAYHEAMAASPLTVTCVGLRHYPDSATLAHPCAAIRVCLDNRNPHDPNAVAVYSNSHLCGHLRREDAPRVRQLLREVKYVTRIRAKLTYYAPRHAARLELIPCDPRGTRQAQPHDPAQISHPALLGIWGASTFVRSARIQRMEFLAFGCCVVYFAGFVPCRPRPLEALQASRPRGPRRPHRLRRSPPHNLAIKIICNAYNPPPTRAHELGRWACPGRGNGSRTSTNECHASCNVGDCEPFVEKGGHVPSVKICVSSAEAAVRMGMPDRPAARGRNCVLRR